jgi:hypothetical protein
MEAIMTDQQLTFEELVQQAMKLSPVEKVRLVERVASNLEHELQSETVSPRPSLYGFLAHLGSGPSDEDIEEIRREMWSNFPREDIL